MRAFVGLCLLALAGCESRGKMDADAEARQLNDSSYAVVSTGVSRASASRPRVVFVGTSLTAGYGLDVSRAYPAALARLAEAEGVPISAVNAGLSGETSAGALRRAEWVLREAADVVVIETGANDALRALDIAATKANIVALVRAAQRLQPGKPVLLVQMEAPPNLGPVYALRFRRMYPEVARETDVALVPFLLEGVAGVAGLNQGDGIHPNVAGAEHVARNVWAALKPILEDSR